jgi:hypothetical protein
MNKSILLVLVVVIGGCATAKPTYGPDGRAAYAVDCSGTAGSWGMCYEKAGSLCGSAGYTVASQSSDKGVIATPSILASTISRSLLVECKKS